MSDQSTTTPLEIVADESKELLAVVQQNALPAEAAQALQSSFAPAFTEARTILQQSRNIVVTDASQKLQIKLAGDYRKALKAIRVGADKTRKELKDESLRRGKAIDGMYNILLHLTETEEKRLQAQEDFAEVQEAKRKEALKLQRTEIMLGIQADPNLYNLAEMGEETFQQLVEGVKLARAAAVERQRKEEADRIAKEAADAAERERIRLENERLKKEADEKEAALKVERERVAKEQAEAALAAKAELDRREALAAAERRKHEEAAAEIRRVAKENADKAEAVLAEQKRKADETAATIKKEADERARKAQAEADKRAAALKEENARIQAELQKERDAQAKRAADAAEAERKAASAPDRDRLLNYANAIRAVEIPEFTTTTAKAIAATIAASRDKFAAWCEEKSSAL